MTTKKRSYAVDALTHLTRAMEYVRQLRKENARLRVEVALLREQLAAQQREAA